MLVALMHGFNNCWNRKLRQIKLTWVLVHMDDLLIGGINHRSLGFTTYIDHYEYDYFSHTINDKNISMNYPKLPNIGDGKCHHPYKNYKDINKKQ